METLNPVTQQEAAGSGRWREFVFGLVSRRSQFARNVALVATASAVAQALLVLASPLITRLYTPKDFGTFAVFASLLSLLTVPACLRFEQAIALPSDDREAACIAMTAVSILFASVAAVSCFLWCFGYHIPILAQRGRMDPCFWILPISLLGSGFHQVLSAWAIRTKAFMVVGKARVSQSVSQIAVQLFIGVLLAGPLGLIVGTFFGRVGGIVSLARNAAAAFHLPEVSALRHVVRRYYRFPILSAPAALLSSLTQNLAALIVAGLFGAITAGLFALVQRLLSIPVGLVSASVNQVYLAESARIGLDRSRQKQLFLSVLKKMLLVGSPLLVVATFDWSVAIAGLFGEHWIDAADFVSPIAVSCYAMLVVTPTGAILDVAERQDLHLLREVFGVAVVSFAGAMAFLFKLSPLPTIEILCAATVAGYCAYACISWWSIHTLPDGPTAIAPTRSNEPVRARSAA